MKKWLSLLGGSGKIGAHVYTICPNVQIFSPSGDCFIIIIIIIIIIINSNIIIVIKSLLLTCFISFAPHCTSFQN